MTQDSSMHQGMRKKLMNQLREKGIRDESVLKAMNEVPRHLFMESTFLRFAYADQAFPIACGQTISQPYTVAFQTELLEIQPHLRVLEIGTGSGYQAAVLYLMGARVFSIERIHQLHQSAHVRLSRLNYAVKLFFGDGYRGLPAFSPFDRILITAAIPELPELLFEQLAPGGILVMPEGGDQGQVMKRIVKGSGNQAVETIHGHFVFVPMKPGTE